VIATKWFPPAALGTRGNCITYRLTRALSATGVVGRRSNPSRVFVRARAGAGGIMTIYGLGFAAVYLSLLFLYLYAYRLRECA